MDSKTITALFRGYLTELKPSYSNGNVVRTYDYDAFGVEKNPDAADTNPFRYCGEYWDKETGTIYLRARYYNPAIGRFISEDTYLGDNTDPLSLNYYLYCDVDPVNRVDPYGDDSYILYDINGISGDKKHTFKDEADIRANQLREKYDTPVWVIGVNNANSFREEWNSRVGYGAFGNSVTVDEVVIIAHGSAEEKNGAGFGYMYFESDDSRLVSTKDAISDSDTDVLISDLNSKTMGSLYFSSCNSGNPDIQNTATAFKNRMTIKNSITAWDGGTIFNYNTGKLEAGAYGGWFRERSRQHTYYKYVDKTWYGKPKRKREGQVIITPTIIPKFGGSHFKAF